MKKIICTTIFTLCLLLTACGKSGDITKLESSVEVAADGSSHVYLSESFDKDYYSETELLDMVSTEISVYNSSNGEGSIKLGDHKLSDGIMKLEFDFADTDAFNYYMPDELYVGSVGGAYEAGYDFNRSLYNASSSENSIGKKDLLKMENEKMIVLSGSSAVKAPGKIKFYSQGMEMLGTDTVRPLKDGLYFIIY